MLLQIWAMTAMSTVMHSQIPAKPMSHSLSPLKGPEDAQGSRIAPPGCVHLLQVLVVFASNRLSAQLATILTQHQH